mmetsp:Transcript_24085/g.55626  ORF Transcript_24085/g.55626 Transcript_24085/m.55626 type:complete len:577 (-) Transcript_24085:127-1857(-)
MHFRHGVPVRPSTAQDSLCPDMWQEVPLAPRLRGRSPTASEFIGTSNTSTPECPLPAFSSTQPIPPTSLLPKKVAAPPRGAAVNSDAVYRAKFQALRPVDAIVARGKRMSASLELPPIRDAPGLVGLSASSSSGAPPDTCGSAPGPIEGSSRYLAPGLRAHVEHFEAFSDPYGSAVSDIDQLKRHVGKLSQIRRETSHIEDMLADGVSGRRWHVEIAAVMQRKHEAELSEQAKHYEQQMKEMKKSLEQEFERRLAAQGQEHNAGYERLRQMSEQLCRNMQQHSEQLQQAVSGGSKAAAMHEQKAQGDRERSSETDSEAIAKEVETALTETASLLATAQTHVNSMTIRIADLMPQLIEAKAQRVLNIALLAWAVAVKDARNDAGHRHQAFEVEAAHSAELSKMQKDLQRATIELRKQRRVHGIAAVHANLDRRMQALLYAWSSITQESQREAAYRQQLDIAAAESAATCAVIRMEGRRRQRELQSQRQLQGLRAVEAERIRVEHVVLRSWIEVLTKARHLRVLSRYFDRENEASDSPTQMSWTAQQVISLHAVLVAWSTVAFEQRGSRQRRGSDDDD